MTFLQLQVNFVNIYVLSSKNKTLLMAANTKVESDSSRRGCLLCDQNSERDTLELWATVSSPHAAICHTM